MRSDPYNVKDEQQFKEDRGYTKCSYKNCDSCNNFIDETTYIEYNATARKYKTRKCYLCSTLYKMYEARCWFSYILETTLIELQKPC